MQFGHSKQFDSDAISILTLTMVQQISKLNQVQNIIVSVNRLNFNQNLKSFSNFLCTSSNSNILCATVIRFNFINIYLYETITDTCTNSRRRTTYSFELLVQPTLLEPKNMIKLLR